ncbi:MAG: nicotinate phosphoribosyltransferase, partial [Erysipelotrichia bacterium]|nr:nicotinate phosphoribosyltransferase [Erysipelotrichia bacterium]
MSQINVEPYIPDEDYDNPAMVTDFYEFTMANCLYLHGFKDTVMVFDMFYRNNPDGQGYAISCGQDKLIKFLLNYHFNEKDLKWLQYKGMSREFCDYLRDYRWKGDLYALREGTVCYPQVPMVRVECDMVGAILIETYLLQTMNFHSLIATKATKISGLSTHRPRNVMEFGTRRAQGESAGNDGAYAAVLGGCVGTANCLAEMKYGPEVKAVGTIAHSFIEFYPSEFEAFEAYAETYPDNVSLLLDTYNILDSGLPNLIKLDDELIRRYPDDLNRRVKSARIDSGDLARGYKKLRKALDKAGKPYVKLVASNSLDEKKMADMEIYEGAKFDSYGVGEKLITSSSSPVFGGVYKLVAVKKADGTYDPKMKCSDSATKAIIPGKLMAWRVFDQEGKGQCDIISMDDEQINPGEPIEVITMDPDAFDKVKTIVPCHVERILIPHILNGKLAIDLPDILAKKEYIKEQLQFRVWESEL